MVLAGTTQQRNSKLWVYCTLKSCTAALLSLACQIPIYVNKKQEFHKVAICWVLIFLWLFSAPQSLGPQTSGLRALLKGMQWTAARPGMTWAALPLQAFIFYEVGHSSIRAPSIIIRPQATATDKEFHRSEINYLYSLSFFRFYDEAHMNAFGGMWVIQDIK